MELIQTNPLKREHVGQLVKLIDAATPNRSSQPTLEARLRSRPNNLKIILGSLALSTVTLIAVALVLITTR